MNTALKNKKEAIEESTKKLQDKFEKSEMIIQANKLDLKKTDKERIRYLQNKAKERENSVQEIKSAILEDIEQKKEIAKLRKMDRDEFMSRRNHYEAMEK